MRAPDRGSCSRAGTPKRTIPLLRVSSWTNRSRNSNVLAPLADSLRRPRLAGHSASAPLAAPVRRPLAHGLEHAIPAHRPRPAPNLPRRRPLVDRKEDDFGPADQVLERHIADAALIRRQARIARIVAIVAHHEIVSRGHFVNLGVVEGSLVTVDLNDFVLDPARKRLDVAWRLHRLIEVADRQIGRDRLARDLLAIDEEARILDLDLIARESDQSLDVVG